MTLYRLSVALLVGAATAAPVKFKNGAARALQVAPNSTTEIDNPCSHFNGPLLGALCAQCLPLLPPSRAPRPSRRHGAGCDWL